MSDNISPIEVTEPYIIALVQFWRREEEPLKLYPLHWAFYVETGPGVGNTYEVVGDHSYTFRIRLNQPLENMEDYRGDCCVGIVSEVELAIMEDILATVKVFRKSPLWNNHNWVETALRALRDSCFSIYREEALYYGDLQDAMLYELESQRGIEDVVEFKVLDLEGEG
ncbi:hypothetical protein BDR05DRAFT_1004505 [Suillus weaverae]|nr:hypothetical protein BDR05DRAFT_1004505 [Suillus weaverae]